jgi:hypothetical protein
MDISYLIENANALFLNKNKDMYVLDFIDDALYHRFMVQTNGGFFFNRSLLIYGLGDVPAYASFVDINLLVNSVYNTFASKAHFFACDFLGNQFAFLDKEVHLLNIETGQFELVAANFSQWLTALSDHLDYYTGQSLLRGWEQQFKQLSAEKRLCPKVPFSMGGQYSIHNLFSVNVEEMIKYNADIASQIYNLPDGTELKLKLTA